MSDDLEPLIQKFGDLSRRFGGHARVFDLRGEAEGFRRTVNDAQRSRMRNHRIRRGVTHVSTLPRAAKSFAREPIYRLDAAVFLSGRPWGGSSGPASWSRNDLTKRFQSGLFVILPDDGGDVDGDDSRPIALAYERVTVWPWVMSDAWWEHIVKGSPEPPPAETDSTWMVAG